MKEAFMKKIPFLLVISWYALTAQIDTSFINSLYRYYLTQSACYASLKELCYDIGHRLSGSSQAARAVKWSYYMLKNYGADSVFLQPVKVPHWIRGKKEQCRVWLNGEKTQRNLKVLALGGSAGTEGIMSLPVIRVNSFDELEKKGREEIEGKIVFYDVAFDDALISQGEAYGKAVKYRSRGASMAAKYGAKAVLIRSMTSARDDEPHTGMLNYDTAVCKTKIPAFALSYRGADSLSSWIRNNKVKKIELFSECKTLPDTLSYNVIGEIKGSQYPEKIILVGGHLDSWDVGHGAHDDGAGIVQSMEVIRAFKKLNYKPKHTIRVVCFMNEENGLRGGYAYADETQKKSWKHIAAIETDAGGFTPRGFGIDTTSGLFSKIFVYRDMLEKYLIQYLHNEGGGADIGPLEKLGVPCIGFIPDNQRYFDIHHTMADTFDKVHKRELELGGAAISALIYIIDRIVE